MKELCEGKKIEVGLYLFGVLLFVVAGIRMVFYADDELTWIVAIVGAIFMVAAIGAHLLKSKC